MSNDAKTLRKRIWGWYFFDWASQPFYTLILSFIFGPYVVAVIAENFMSSGLTEEAAGARATTTWSIANAVTGVIIALMAPVLGAIADNSRGKMAWIVAFSVLYVAGCMGLWRLAPDGVFLWQTLIIFGLTMIGVEITTSFTNALLPGLGSKDEVGKISGWGYAIGYAGGIASLIIMLALFAETESGKTYLGINPIFGLNAEQREGTRFVGPLAAIWYVVFMIPFFLWVREAKNTGPKPSVRESVAQLKSNLRAIPHNRSLLNFLLSSMLYRDSLVAFYTFGGTYAKLVLGWPVAQVGVFGVVGALSAALATWGSGIVDQRRGPKFVVVISIIVLAIVATVYAGMTRESLFGQPLAEGSNLPDILMYVLGATMGAAGGTLQASSRTLMVRHTDDRPAEAFGIYALAGKSTAFVGTALVGLFAYLFQDTRFGILPLIALFLISLYLLRYVKADGERASSWSVVPSSPSSQG